VRSVDVAYTKVLIQRNTFFHDGVAAAGAGKSEVNLDSTGSGANTNVTLNILASTGMVFNDCYDAFARNYVLVDNFVDGTVPTGAAGNCVSGSTAGAAMFVDPAMGDFHSPIAAGAYAP
jgi:hypothetical protein